MKMVDLKEVERTELRKQAYKGVEGKSELSQIMILPFAEETGQSRLSNDRGYDREEDL